MDCLSKIYLGFLLYFRSENPFFHFRIFFIKGYEEYSARVDKERDVRAAEEAARLAREFDEAERRRIAEEQRTAQLADKRNEKHVRQQDRDFSEENGRTIEQTCKRKTKGYHFG